MVADYDIAVGLERGPGSNSLNHGNRLGNLGAISHPDLSHKEYN